jgi:hypothetical protein
MEIQRSHTVCFRGPRVSLVASVFLLLSPAQGVASAQDAGVTCVLNQTVRECVASGSLLSQLRDGILIQGSEASVEALAKAMALEVGTAPSGSSSGGFTFTFDPSIGTFSRRAVTFGPAFSERALTIGKGKLSGGFNFLYRSYDRMDGLDLDGFDVFKLQGSAVTLSSYGFNLKARTSTLAGFAGYGVLNNLDVGVLVPYVLISVTGASRLYSRSHDELQRVLISASTVGLGDIAIFGKYRFWSMKRESAASEEVQGGLAAEVTVRVPSGNVDDLVGLGVTRTLLALIGSTTAGRLSPHVNIGYEVWSTGVAFQKGFQGSTVTAKDQVQYSAGLEYDLHPKLSLMVDALGRYQRGAGGVGYQPFVFPANIAQVDGAEALVAVPAGVNTLFVVPGAKWNIFRSALLTTNVLVPLTSNGLRTRVTPAVGIEWSF